MKVVKIGAVILLVVGVFLAVSRLVRRQENITRTSAAFGKAEQQNTPISTNEVAVFAIRPAYKGEIKDLSNFEILDNGEIWATNFSTDYLYHSLDSGKTWLPVQVPSNGYRLNSVSFLNANLGFALNNAGLLRTADGGQSWKPLTVSTPVVLDTIHFVNPQLGFIGGREAFANPPYSDETKGSLEILCTSDGGDSWKRCYQENKPSNLFEIVSLSESSVFAVLNARRLLHTTDQGKTWKESSGPIGSMMSFAIAGNGSMWRVGTNKNFQYSNDGGNTWKSAHLPPDLANKQWKGIRFNHNGGGMVSGDGMEMAYTCDNGDTWQQYTLSPPESSFPAPENLSRIAMHGDLAIVSSNRSHYFLRMECATTQP